MKLNIKSKLILSFGLVLLLFVIVILIDFNAISESNDHIMHIKDVANKQVEYLNTIKISVIQVQQWLTDAALTKSQDSLKEAEKYKVDFKDSIKRIEELNCDVPYFIHK
ncbi:MAG: MCP four helix bundle domain-containing protein [Clostridiales bacterium]|nr:MCP four helix bundle domain-containing protein [Eubacteriales bacterium]MDH7567842.1 MCP four helix bundle domain-containing protein [Clostridiales bacterium]